MAAAGRNVYVAWPDLRSGGLSDIWFNVSRSP